ncbi:MAG: class I SAM-dependent methyltransferase [Myxococcota bacterium]
MLSSYRERHGKQLGIVRAGWRALRRASGPLKQHLRRKPDPLAIQRSARLAPEDASYKRRRWHVLVDLIHDRCPAQDAIVVDLGTYNGSSSAHIHKYCPQVKWIYAIDIREPDPERSLIRDLPRVKFVQGYSDACAEQFPDESVDLIFVDADHSQAGVQKDLAAWSPKIKRGGVIAGHDYGSRRHPGVKRAVDAFFAGHPNPIELQSDMVWWTLK